VLTGQSPGGAPVQSAISRPDEQAAAGLLDGVVARAYGVLPIAVEEGVLLIGIADTTDMRTLRVLRTLSGMRVRAVAMSTASIAEGQTRLYPDEPTFDTAGATRAPAGGAPEGGRARAALAGVPFVSLQLRHDGTDPVDPQAAQLLDEGFCRHFEVIALAIHNRVVVIATANPSDTATVRAAALMAGGEPLTVAASSGDVEQALSRSFATALAAEVALRDAARRPGRMRLGDMLLHTGALDRQALAQALRTQEQTGDPLGAILLHSGAIDEDQLVVTLAEQLRLPAVRIDSARLDPDVLALVPRQLMIRHHVVPIAVEAGRLVLAMVDPLDDGTLASLAEHLTLPVRPVLATDTEIDRAIQAITASDHVELAASQLMRRMPVQSADHVLSRGQKRVFTALLVIVATAVAIKPIATIVLLNVGSVFLYAAFSVYRFRLIYNAIAHDFEFPVSAAEIARLDERTLPTYTVLVPLYHEAEVLPRLVSAIAALDYPTTKLDVKILVEQDDEQTIAAFRELDPPLHFRLVVVPDSQPKTKPKACNYGLAQARGEYVVIYDAEDRPEPDQLKKIVVAFANAGPEVACIQCKLNYYNREQNLLTRWFTCEYSMWFDLLLPGLDAAGAPIPLGGTSNHFLTTRLVELGAWDPYNVAEDADLGVRLSRAGYRTAIIDSTTFEEANSELGNWIRQRSRWVKGYIQTWLVHMRHPLVLLRELGPRRFLSFQLLVGGTPGVFLLNPLYWGLTTAWTLAEYGVIKSLFPGVLYYAAAVALYLGNFTLAFAAAAGIAGRGHHDLVKHTLISPLYWGLMSIGAWKGLMQLIRRPHYWEKTCHGLDAPKTLVSG